MIIFYTNRFEKMNQDPGKQKKIVKTFLLRLIIKQHLYHTTSINPSDNFCFFLAHEQFIFEVHKSNVLKNN